MLSLSRPILRLPRGGLLAVAAIAAAVGLTGVAQSSAAASGSGRITGSVTINGQKAQAVRVAVFEASQDRATEWPIAETVTKSTGAYTLRLPAGQYRIVADAGDYGYHPVWWTATAAGSAAVPVDVGDTVTGLDVVVSGKASFPLRSAGVSLPQEPAGLAAVAVDPIEGYQGQTRCRAVARAGTVALRQLVVDTYGDLWPGYLNRECGADTSEHYDGRALDWMVNSRIGDQARAGDAFTRWITRSRGTEPGVVARRLGIMYMIWRGRIWKQYQAELGWQPYSQCLSRSQSRVEFDNGCHRNHIHISLTHRGAAMKTTWWQAAALQ